MVDSQSPGNCFVHGPNFQEQQRAECVFRRPARGRGAAWAAVPSPYSRDLFLLALV